MTNINTFQGDVFIHEYIKHTGDENNLFGFSDTDTFKIATAGTDRLTVKADGDVGIGVAAPAGILDIRASSADPGAKPTVHIGDNAADAGDYGMLQLVRSASAGTKCHMSIIRSGNTVTGMGYYNNDTNTFCVWPGFTNVNETPAISVSSDGNVGIGTSDPKDDLHIFEASNGQTTGLFIEKQTGGSGTAQITFGVAASSEGAKGKPKAGIFFERTGSNGRGELHFCIDSNSDDNAVALSDVRMAIKNDGRVGIGTHDPACDLHIQGSSGEMLRATDGTRTFYMGCDSNDPWVGTSTNHKLRFINNGQESARFNVGSYSFNMTQAMSTMSINPQTYRLWNAFNQAPTNTNGDFYFSERGMYHYNFCFANGEDQNITHMGWVGMSSNGAPQNINVKTSSYTRVHPQGTRRVRFFTQGLPNGYNNTNYRIKLGIMMHA